MHDTVEHYVRQNNPDCKSQVSHSLSYVGSVIKAGMEEDGTLVEKKKGVRGKSEGGRWGRNDPSKSYACTKMKTKL